eukprot:CAMPEP_0176100064 /NCGR_PEP_ID=MMETSP0120_2-20121206/50187_1 /TAXON_ID=160619 /ORGANISM="Kryptoperidinium foliaceum, Strain CCMP 1326" /LENGTH=124 /DNA_ID=CAMNT_0017434107 /DNA_START=53 /DNA_END=427 /DNA_ORIENTATION=+
MAPSYLAALMAFGAIFGGVLSAAAEALAKGDICYRFCEDGSELEVSRRSDCPADAPCGSLLPPDVASFDSCGDRAHVCREGAVVPNSASTGNTSGAVEDAARTAFGCGWASAALAVSLAFSARL